RVIDPDGNPVAKATIAAVRPEVHSKVGRTFPVDKGPNLSNYRAETKNDGTYEIVLAASGDSEYSLIALDDSGLTRQKFAQAATELMRTVPGQVIKNLDIQLYRPSVVRGRVMSDEGLSVGGLAVRASAFDGRGKFSFDPATKTTDDGTFEIG